MPESATPLVQRIARVLAGAAHSSNAEGSDPSAAAKVVKQYKKDAGDAGAKLVVKGGLIEGEILSASRVENELATMPGKDELRATLLATLQAPLQQFVMLLNAPAQNFVYVLSAKERQGA